MMTEDERELVAYCGLNCADCFAHKGRMADLARDLRAELRQSRFDKTAGFMSTLSFFKVFEDYQKCYEVLGAMVKLRCSKGCRGGGGNPYCGIRKCAQKKELEGCWECGEFESCGKLNFLKQGHGDAHLKNLRKLKKKGIEEFLKGKTLWYAKPKE